MPLFCFYLWKTYIPEIVSRLFSGEGERDLEDTDEEEDDEEEDLLFSGDRDLSRSTSSSLESEE